MVRWSVLGTAQIAKVCVIPAILKSENGVLQAIASRDLAKAQSLVEKHRQGVAFASYAAFLMGFSTACATKSPKCWRRPVVRSST
jgi:predicted dehydrogenase